MNAAVYDFNPKIPPEYIFPGAADFDKILNRMSELRNDFDKDCCLHPPPRSIIHIRTRLWDWHALAQNAHLAVNSMKIHGHQIEVTARLELSGRELAVLYRMMSYDNKSAFVATMCNSEYPAEEMVELMKNIRRETGILIGKINSAKQTIIPAS